MRRGAHLIAGAILASVSTLHSAEAAHARLLFRVDKVSAIIQGTTLTIDAIGAVSTGGWGRPRLRVKPSAPEAHIVEVEFSRGSTSREKDCDRGSVADEGTTSHTASPLWRCGGENPFANERDHDPDPALNLIAPVHRRPSKSIL